MPRGIVTALKGINASPNPRMDKRAHKCLRLFKLRAVLSYIAFLPLVFVYCSTFVLKMQESKAPADNQRALTLYSNYSENIKNG